MIVQGNLGDSDHEILHFRILMEEEKESNRKENRHQEVRFYVCSPLYILPGGLVENKS